MRAHLTDAAPEANKDGKIKPGTPGGGGDKKKKGSNSLNDQKVWRKGTEGPSLFPILDQKAAARSPFPLSRSEHKAAEAA